MKIPVCRRLPSTAPFVLPSLGGSLPFRFFPVSQRTVLVALLSTGFVLAALSLAQAQATATLTTLHRFGSKSGTSNGLVLGSNGNFYGTTYGNLGSDNTPEYPGTAFRITPAGKFTAYDVFDDGPVGSNEIQHPMGTLALGSDGNFYGTSRSALSTGDDAGTVFQLTPTGGLTTLYNTSFNSGIANGGLVQASGGGFYGTTSSGGTSFDGTVFKVTSAGKYTILYSFADGSDGAVPLAPLVRGSDGNFYGTTSGSPTMSHMYPGVATLFQITPAGALTTLASYTDDSEPLALVAGSDGNLYYLLGNTVFRMNLAGVATALYTFTGGSDGTSPNTLMQAGDGNLYGTTSSTVFQLTLAGVLTTLYNFSGDDGVPNSTLVQGDNGNFYGTTAATIFQLTVPPTVTPPAPVINSPPTANAQVGSAFMYQIAARNSPTSFDTVGLPADLIVDPATGLISGIPAVAGTFTVTLDAGNGGGTGTATLTLVVAPPGGSLHPAFFTGEAALADGVYYLAFPNGNFFGYYSFLADPAYLYHFDLGFEYVFDAVDGKSGVYLYDFASGSFFYTSPGFPFPYLYDFTLNTVLYYYPDPNNSGHYNTNGVRYFYDFDTDAVISK